MKERFRRRRLPHVDKPGAIYFVTSCLAGSIPAAGLSDLSSYRDKLSKRPQHDQTRWKLDFARMDRWLDQELAVSHLRDERLAMVVCDSLLHFAGSRYSVWAWVVMSNHIHWVFEPIQTWVSSLGASVDGRSPRERIMHSVKRHSALECHRIMSVSGAFWQDESYDHCVDDAAELLRIIDYVEQNPVKAGLCSCAEDFQFSSAAYRREHRIESGRPLIGPTRLSAFD